jgi:hypothetical protein
MVGFEYVWCCRMTSAYCETVTVTNKMLTSDRIPCYWGGGLQKAYCNQNRKSGVKFLSSLSIRTLDSSKGLFGYLTGWPCVPITTPCNWNPSTAFFYVEFAPQTIHPHTYILTHAHSTGYVHSVHCNPHTRKMSVGLERVRCTVLQVNTRCGYCVTETISSSECTQSCTLTWSRGVCIVLASNDDFLHDNADLPPLLQCTVNHFVEILLGFI